MYDFKPFFLRILFFQPSGAPSPSSHERSKFLVVVASSLKTFFSLFFLHRVASPFFASRAFLWLTLAPSTSFFEVFGGKCLFHAKKYEKSVCSESVCSFSAPYMCKSEKQNTNKMIKKCSEVIRK